MDFNERKRKVESLLHIKFPTSWAPPPIPVLRPGGGGGYRNHREDVERHSRMMEAIEAERRELMKLPDAELDATYAEATRKVQERAKLKADLEERGRFFHQPNAAADFAYWSKVEYWTLDESLALLLGKSPEVVTWKTVQAYVNISEFAKAYERLRNLALRAQAMNRGQTAVYPSAVLAWAADMDIAVPQGLKDAMAERDARKRAAAASREEAKRLHDQLLGDGVLEAFKAQPAQAVVPAAPVPPTPSRPIEYVHTLTVSPNQKLFPLSEVPTMTAHAIQQEAFGRPPDESVPEERLLFATTVLTHKEQLRTAVLAGAVVPYSRVLMTPAPREWNDDPRAGDVLPIGELRKFADTLLMEVKAEAREVPEPQEAEGATQPEQSETAETSAQATVVHTLATRRDVLDPVIDLAEKTATNADDRAAVWNALTALAVAKDKPHPLLGFADGSVQYLAGDDAKFLTRDAFNKRWDRRKEKAAANRR